MSAKRTVILVDGAFYLRRTLQEYGNLQPTDAAKLLTIFAEAHTDGSGNAECDQLIRTYFYDCAPLDRECVNPISREVKNFRDMAQNRWRMDYHEAIKGEPKLMLRLGHIQCMDEWTLRPDKMTELLGGRLATEDIHSDDIHPVTRQKGVDVQIGMDLTRIAMKGMADKVILVAGDGDFVPVVQLAREEGLEVVVDNMKTRISRLLYENIDDMVSVDTEAVKARLNAFRQGRTGGRNGYPGKGAPAADSNGGRV